MQLLLKTDGSDFLDVVIPYEISFFQVTFQIVTF